MATITAPQPDDVLVTHDDGTRHVFPAALRPQVEAVLGLDAASAARALVDARQRATRARRREVPRLTDAAVRGLHEALLHRALPDRYPATAAAARWLDYCPLVEVADSWLTMGGDPDPRASGRHGLAMAWLVRGGGRRGFAPVTRQHGFTTTGDLPGLLDGAARVIFLDSYNDTVRSFTAWTSAVSLPDFRSTIVSAAAFPSLLEVPEHAEYEAGFPFGPAVPVRLTNFGRIVQYTRAAVLRDDVASFGQLQQALGVAAASVENDAVYELLGSNPRMADGQPLFSAAQANLMPAAALDAASLAVACAALAANSLHGRPAFLLCGTADGPTARRLVHEESGAGAASGALEVVQDDRITGGWYVTTDPGERPTLVTAHLADTDGPELLTRDEWTIDARAFKGRDEFGAAVVDWRGMVRTPAAS